MLIVLQAIFDLSIIGLLIFGIWAWINKQYRDVKYGPKYTDFGGTEDFSSRHEYDEKDPWSMFRESK